MTFWQPTISPEFSEGLENRCQILFQSNVAFGAYKKITTMKNQQQNTLSKHS